MSNPTRILSYACGALAGAYLFLIGCTVYFAAQMTQLSNALHEGESRVGVLEQEYYDAISHLGAKDPALLGFAAPRRTHYVSSGQTALSLLPASNTQ